jgi:hypothetical protein
VVVRRGILVLAGSILLVVMAAGSRGSTRPRMEVDGPAPASEALPPAAPAVFRPPAPAAPDGPVEIDGPVAMTATPYETVLLKSAPGRRHWRVDPQEIRAVEDLRDAAFEGLALTPPFGGGLRVTQPGRIRLGLLRDLEAGDVIREINGLPVGDATQFRLLASRLWRRSGVVRATIDRGGAPVVVTYQRAGTPLTTGRTTEPRSSEGEAAPAMAGMPWTGFSGTSGDR